MVAGVDLGAALFARCLLALLLLPETNGTAL
jgi:hypothetical protein